MAGPFESRLCRTAFKLSNSNRRRRKNTHILEHSSMRRTGPNVMPMIVRADAPVNASGNGEPYPSNNTDKNNRITGVRPSTMELAHPSGRTRRGHGSNHVSVQSLAVPRRASSGNGHNGIGDCGRPMRGQLTSGVQNATNPTQGSTRHGFSVHGGLEGSWSR